MLFQFSLFLSWALCGLALENDEREMCADTKFRGSTNRDTGIVHHTLKYGTIPARWEPAQMVEYARHQTHDASGSSQKCTQLVCVACGWRPPKINIADPESFVEGTEQCLYLSAFTPKNDFVTDIQAKQANTKHEALLPVVFHIHHGQLLYGFKTEHGEVKNVVKRKIIVANSNFRLGAMGFLAHPDLQQVNVGQQDLALSLQWVKKYICSLGGDPRKVTITGSSTGAAQALLLLASKSTEGLFHGAWVNSQTSFGMPDFFSGSVATIFEKEIRSSMLGAGCATLDCMREVPAKQLYLNFLNANSPLVQITPKMAHAMPTRPYTAYDGWVVPDMGKAACDNTISRRDLPVVVGQGRDELDTLKFQFHLPKMVKNMVAMQAEKMGVSDPNTVRCMQRDFLQQQGVQETAEDALFHLGSYLGSSASNTKPNRRWHFLITAPASKTNRAWHTLPELLAWNPDPQEDTAQYDKLTKQFVYGNASPELMTYFHENFLHFAQTGTPKDKGWTQTTPVQQGEIGGLPSKIMDNSPLSTYPHNEYHHSNHTIKSFHRLSCSQRDVLPLAATIEHCKNNPAPELTEMDDFLMQMSTIKKSDILFDQEMKKAWNPVKVFKLLKEEMKGH